MEFDLQLIHTAGPKMVQSDTLSRRPDYTPENNTDNENITLLPDNLFVNLIDVDLQNWIMNCTNMDKDATDALSYILDYGSSTIRHDLNDWTLEKVDGKNVFFYKDKNYIPKDLDLRRDIAKMFHDHKTAGHPGELETYNAIRQHYWGEKSDLRGVGDGPNVEIRVQGTERC
jgi:hypothetical protein